MFFKKRTIRYKRDFINKKMHSLKNLRSNCIIVKCGNKKLSQSSNRIPKREKRLISTNIGSFFRKNATCRKIQTYKSSIITTSILIFICDVLISQVAAQIDLGTYYLVILFAMVSLKFEFHHFR